MAKPKTPTASGAADQYPSLYERTGNIEDINTLLVPRASMTAKAPAAEPTGWYALAADGMATLCVDRDDAEKTAADSEKKWPNCGPFRAVQLYTAPPAPTEQQIGTLQAELAGNEAATMHLSRMVDELRALLCQAMRVMKDLHESATPDESREDCPPIIPTSDFAKFVNDNAALMYAIKQCGHDAAPPKGAAKGANDAASS